MVDLFETIITNEAKKNVNEVLNSGFLNQGKFVDSLEDKLEKEFWLKNVVSLNSCTSSLHLSLLLSNVKKGDKIITSPQSFISTGLSILMCGAEPIFCDVDIFGNLNPNTIQEEDLIKSKAVLFTNWAGNIADLEKLNVLAKKYNLSLISDSAHALGANYKQSVVGDCKYTDFDCFSLQCIKSLTSGDGGLLCCKNEEDKEKAIKLRWFNISKKNIQRNENGERIFDIDSIGFKYHLNDFCASLAVGNLHNLKGRINKRYAYAQIYNNRLKDIHGIINLPIFEDRKNSFWLYNFLVENRNGLIKKLRDNNIMASTVDTRIDKYTLFKPYQRDLPGMDYFEEHQLSIPCISSMEIDDVVRICDIIKEGW